MRFFLVLSLLTGCASTTHQSSVVTAQPTYELKRFTQADLQRVADWFFANEGQYPNGYEVGLIAEWIQSPDPNDPTIIYMADGITIPEKNKILVLAWQDCLADSALIHEFFHALGYSEHKETIWKHVEDVHARAVKELCPTDYVRKLAPPPNARFVVQGEKDGDSKL